MVKRYFLFTVLLLSNLFFLSCYKKGNVIPNNKTFANDSITVENVSYLNYIHPLLQKNCSTCHGKGGSAEPWWYNTNTYQNAMEYGNPIYRTINNNTMPPPPKFPFTDRDKELIKAWIEK